MKTAAGHARGRAVSPRETVFYLLVLPTTVALAAALAVGPTFFTVLALALAVGVAIAHRIGVSAAISAFAIVMAGLSGHIERLYPAMAGLNAAAVGALAIVGVASMRRRDLPRGLMVSTLGFLGICVAWSVPAFSKSLTFGFDGLVALISAPLTVIAVSGSLAGVKGRQRSEAIASISFAILIVTVATVAVGLRQALIGLNGSELAATLASGSTFQVGDQVRLMGTFLTNQDFGCFAAAMCPALVVVALRVPKARLLVIPLLALLLATNFLSLTRTSILAAGAGTLIAVVLWGRGEPILRLLAVMCGGGFALASLLPLLSSLNVTRVDRAIARVQTLFSLATDRSFQARSESTIPIALRYFADSPWGLGAGAAGPVSQAHPSLAPVGPLIADNGYLAIALQLGIVGLGVWVAMLVTLFVSLIRVRRTASLASAAAVISLMLAMLTAGYWSLLSPMTLIAGIVGLGVAEVEREHRRRADTHEDVNASATA